MVRKVIRNLLISYDIRRSKTRRDIREIYFGIPVLEGYTRTINLGCDFTHTHYAKLEKLTAPKDYFGAYSETQPYFKKTNGITTIKSTIVDKKAT